VPTVVAALDPAGLAAAAADAVATWRADGLVAFPTETVYGLGAAARSAAGVARIFAAKGRPTDHPLIVHLASVADLDRWARDVPAAAERLARACWPGPLTLILRRRDDVLAAVTGGQPTVALRVPGHPVALALLEAFGDGIAAPSANRFGRVSPTCAAHVTEDLGHLDDLLVVDGGPCPIGIESTIVDLSGRQPVLRRLGGFERAALEAVLGEKFVDPAAASGPAPRVPGALARHYAPDTPARLVPVGAGDAAPDDVAVLARRAAPPEGRGAWARLPDDPQDAARALYRDLRTLDAAGARELWLEVVPAGRAWAAIADRLARAVAGTAAPGPEEGT